MAQSRTSSAASTGIGMGCALAIAVSWTQYHSLMWAIAHGLFGWAYVIYFAITRNGI